MAAVGVRPDKLQTEPKSVELEDADSVRVEIRMGAGDLEVSGGADKLLEADFTYNVAEFRPEVKYSGGTLIVRQACVGGCALGDNDRCEWDLRLNNDVPMDLSIGLGAGTSHLKRAGLSLSTLDIEAAPVGGR